MKFSILTPVFNGRETIRDTIASLMSQTCKDFESIVIDGGSTDGTLERIQGYTGNLRVISGPDRGLYDGLNKGIRQSAGEIIGILHADDLYAQEKVLEMVAGALEDPGVDACYGDLQYVAKRDLKKVIRYWKSDPYRPGRFKLGWMPPHPTFFVKKEIYERFGSFNLNFRIAADYELMLRFLEKHGISTRYVPHVLVKMRMGGISNRSFKNIVLKSREDYRAWKVNGLPGSFCTLFLKNLSKIPQFFRK